VPIVVSATRCASGNPSIGSPTPTATLSVATAPAAGATLLLASACASDTKVLSAVSDPRGNSYVLVGDSGNTGTLGRVTLFVCWAQAGLLAGDVLTLTFSAASASALVALDAATGLGTSADRTAVGFSTTNTSSVSIGPSVATVQADELVWVPIYTSATNLNTQTLSAGAGYTVQAARVAGSPGSVHVEYRIVSSTGAQTATGTLNTTASKYAGLLVTLRGPTAAVSARRPTPQVIG